MRTFGGLLGKVLPLQVTGESGWLVSRSSGSCTHRCERRDQRSRSCKTFTLHLISVLAVTGSLAACANLLCLPPEQTEARLPRAAPPRPTAPAAAARAQTRPPTPKPRPETTAPEVSGRPSPPPPIQLPPKPASGVAQITPAVHLSLGQAVPASWGGDEPNCDCTDILCGRPIQSCLRRSPPSLTGLATGRPVQAHVAMNVALLLQPRRTEDCLRRRP